MGFGLRDVYLGMRDSVGNYSDVSYKPVVTVKVVDFFFSLFGFLWLASAVVLLAAPHSATAMALIDTKYIRMASLGFFPFFLAFPFAKRRLLRPYRREYIRIKKGTRRSDEIRAGRCPAGVMDYLPEIIDRLLEGAVYIQGSKRDRKRAFRELGLAFAQRSIKDKLRPYATLRLEIRSLGIRKAMMLFRARRLLCQAVPLDLAASVYLSDSEPRISQLADAVSAGIETFAGLIDSDLLKRMIAFGGYLYLVDDVDTLSPDHAQIINEFVSQAAVRSYFVFGGEAPAVLAAPDNIPTVFSEPVVLGAE